MNKIKLSFTKQSNGKYLLVVNQNDIELFSQEKSPNAEDAVLYTKLVSCLQRCVDKELEANPKFIWKSMEEYKKFAGSSRIRDFLLEEDEKKNGSNGGLKIK